MKMMIGMVKAPQTKPALRFIAFNIGGTAKLEGGLASASESFLDRLHSGHAQGSAPEEASRTGLD